MKKVVIIGGVAGGASAAARLRRLDETAEIIMLERGEHISFANCGLPYFIGGEITDESALTLQTPTSFNARFNVEVRVFSKATAINRTEKTVTVQDLQTGETYAENYDYLILSPGASPLLPPIEGVHNSKVFTLRDIPDTKKIKSFIEEAHPASAVVVGGGYIGMEMAENLVHAGIKVTIVEMTNQVIAPLDFDMAASVHAHLQEKGITLILEDAVCGIFDKDDHLSVKLNHSEITTDMLIMAAGVRPESALAQKADLSINERGAIIVNKHMQTSDESIFAVGDAVEVTDFITEQKALIPLAGPANKQGRIAADNIYGIPSSYEGTQGSAILRVFDLTIATTGINEKTAQKLGLYYDKVFTHPASHAGYYPGAQAMTIKTLFEKVTGKILGAQIVGFEGVDKRCDVLATALRAHMSASDLAELELCYAPPYSSAKDPVNMVGFVIENLLTGKVKNFHWHDIDALPKDGSATLLDTRTAAEFDRGSIEGFINIPLDDLRSRLEELDPGKKVYVVCQVGLRGYIASRILIQQGFDAYNLSGGYKLWETIYPKN
ncbi:MAG: FAD-dependent oxidoreductase [Coriobacteriaceae bacterium]|nr:FAD-dependent oxidoreductase [Coriobacteriaceae bacterium]